MSWSLMGNGNGNDVDTYYEKNLHLNWISVAVLFCSSHGGDFILIFIFVIILKRTKT